MKSVVRLQSEGKAKDVGLRGLSTVPAAESVDAKVALIQARIPRGHQVQRVQDRAGHAESPLMVMVFTTAERSTILRPNPVGQEERRDHPRGEDGSESIATTRF